jgi:hypothetical protein
MIARGIARLKWLFVRAHSQLFIVGGLLMVLCMFPIGKAMRDQLLGLVVLAIGNWIRHVGPTLKRHRERGGQREGDEPADGTT